MIARKSLFFLVIAGLLPGLLLAEKRSAMLSDPADNPVAMVSSFHGQVSVGKQARKLELFDELRKGDIVRTGKGSTLTLIYYHSGYKYRISGDTEIRVDRNDVLLISGRPVLKQKTPYRERIKIRPSGLAQAAEGMSAAVGRRNERVYLSLQPSVHLHIIKISRKASLVLYDNRGHKIWNAPIRLTGYPQKVKVAATGLVSGHLYRWQVSAGSVPGLIVAKGMFRIAGKDLRQQASLRRPAYDSDMSDKVLYASWLESVGVVDEASRYWRKLSSEYRTNKRLAELAR